MSEDLLIELVDSSLQRGLTGPVEMLKGMVHTTPLNITLNSLINFFKLYRSAFIKS